MHYLPRQTSLSASVPLRTLQYHVLQWGSPDLSTRERPALVLLHGWMDVAASFQFVVDALSELEGAGRYIIAPDWRGFGGTAGPAADTYWFADYLGDLDALLDALAPAGAIDLVGHSMGGNVAMTYAGVRPARVRRLVNLEGFGMPLRPPAEAPRRLERWLDDLRMPQTLRSYASIEEVAARLMRNNPLLTPDKAAWLAPHWSAPQADGRWHILGDPAHMRANPVLYRVDEHLEMWKRITAPLLWVEGDRTDVAKWWGTRYPRAEFETRLAWVPQVEKAVLSPSGHMLHHDQPAALAAHLARFLA